MTTTFILGYSSVQFLRITMTFRDGGTGFISQSMNRNSDFDNTSVRIWMNSIEENTCVITEMGIDSDEDEEDDIQFVPLARSYMLWTLGWIMV